MTFRKNDSLLLVCLGELREGLELKLGEGPRVPCWSIGAKLGDSAPAAYDARFIFPVFFLIKKVVNCGKIYIKVTILTIFSCTIW